MNEHDPYEPSYTDISSTPTTEPVRVDGAIDGLINLLIAAALISLAVLVVVAWMRMP